jgi:hypothetical protein
VLAKRKTKTERGVDGFAAATRSSVSAIRAQSEMKPLNASAEGKSYSIQKLSADGRRLAQILYESSSSHLSNLRQSAKSADQTSDGLEQDCASASLN